MENLQQSTYENAGRLMNLYDYMAAIGDDNYENLYDDITQDVDVRYKSDNSDYQEWVDQLAKEHDLFSKESMEKINARFEPQIFVADDSAKIAPVVYDNQYDTYLTLEQFADELESYADMDIEGENEVYQEGYFSPYYMDEPPTKKVSFSGTLETSMRELVQDFYQWLGEIDNEIAQHLEQVSEDKNIPASEVAVLAISQSDRLMTANDYLVASSPDIYSMYEDIADYGFNYDVNLDNSLLQSKMPEIEKIIQEHGGVSNRTQDELEDRFEPQVLVRDSGEAIVTPLVYDNQENKYITVSSVADTLKEMLIPDVHGEITAENGESIPFNAHMDVESESKRILADSYKQNATYLKEALVEVREAYKDDMPKLKATVDHFKEKMSILYDKRQSEVQPKKDSQNIER